MHFTANVDPAGNGGEVIGQRWLSATWLDNQFHAWRHDGDAIDRRQRDEGRSADIVDGILSGWTGQGCNFSSVTDFTRRTRILQGRITTYWTYKNCLNSYIFIGKSWLPGLGLPECNDVESS